MLTTHLIDCRCKRTTSSRCQAPSTTPRRSLSLLRLPSTHSATDAAVAASKTIPPLLPPSDLAVTPQSTQQTPPTRGRCPGGPCPRLLLARPSRRNSTSIRLTTPDRASAHRPCPRTERRRSATLASPIVTTPRNWAPSRTPCREDPQSSATCPNGEESRCIWAVE